MISTAQIELLRLVESLGGTADVSGETEKASIAQQCIDQRWLTGPLSNVSLTKSGRDILAQFSDAPVR